MKSERDYVNYSLPEIAIAGRSNAGKSSLINLITNNSKLAKVSSTPGKTRLVNFFLLNDEVILTDLPGYGYAKVSKQEKATWDQMVSDYFEITDNLRCIFVLMDIRHLPNDYDKQMLYYSQVKCIPFVLVATKADKIAKSKRIHYIKKILDELKIQSGVDTVAFSTLDKTGKEDITELIFKYASLPKNEAD